MKVDAIVIPKGEITLETLRALEKCLGVYNKRFAKAKLPVKLSGFNLLCLKGNADRYMHIYPGTLAGVSGSVSNNIAKTLIQLLLHLRVDNSASAEEIEIFRTSKSWEAFAYRLTSMLFGAIETSCLESDSLAGKATRTTDIAFQCRVATTIDAACKMDECLMNPEMAKYLGLRDENLLLVGRNPMPKMSTLALRTDEKVPFGVLLINALCWHAICEGDADGDSVFFLAFTSKGDLIVPKEGLYSPKIN